jgi:hypothetical protein
MSPGAGFCVTVNDFARWLLYLLVACPVAGCSVNSVGFKPFLTVDSAENIERGKYVRYEARGLHLYTRGAVGLHLGTMSRGLLYPELSKNTDACVEYALAGSAAGEKKYSENRKADDTRISDVPVYITSKQAGVGFEFNRFSFRLNLGFQRRNQTRLAADASALVVIDHEDPWQHVSACAIAENSSGDVK